MLALQHAAENIIDAGFPLQPRLRFVDLDATTGKYRARTVLAVDLLRNTLVLLQLLFDFEGCFI